jgi:DNA-binding CsgD family transcriptional regulator/tetratricopeptide (TPR) repeat protein
MSTPPRQSVTAGALVGRHAELAVLREQQHAVWQGTGSAVVISGEAGIGKSRLVHEISRQCASPPPPPDGAGVRSLRCQCFEPDRALPYAPIVDLLRTWLGRCTPAEVAGHLGSDAPALATLLSACGISIAPPPPVPTLPPEQERLRLFHTLVGLFTRLAASTPLLVVVEDLHWSDDTSLDFLLHLIRRVHSVPLLLLLTYRSDEVTPSLQHMLALLDRERLALEIILQRLALPDVDAMLRDIFRQTQPIRPDFLQAVHGLTDGNPFFVEEVVRSLIAAGDIFQRDGRWERKGLADLCIPRSVHDAVTRRSQALSQAARSVLDVAAVAGRIFDFDVLQAVTGHDERALLALIRELIATQLVVEDSADRFAFRHALTRQAIYEALLARERQALHREIAEAIEQLHGAARDPDVADLSYHFAEGQAWARALTYAEQAGARATALHAPRAAVEHYSRALAAIAHLPDGAEGRPEQLTRLYGHRGRAWALLGDFDRAREDHQKSLALAAGAPLAEWQALLDLGHLWAGLDYARAGEYFAEASRVAAALDAPLARAQSLTALGAWDLNMDRLDEATQSLQAALALFEREADRRGIATVVDLLGMVSQIGGDMAQMRRYFERAAELFRALDDRRGLSSTLAAMAQLAGCFAFETVVTPPGVPMDQAEKEARQAQELAGSIGWRAGEAFAVLSLGVCLVSRGEYGRGLSTLRESLAIAQEIQHGEWTTFGRLCQGLIFLDLLAPAQAREHLERASALARENGSQHCLALAAACLAEACVAGGDLAAAGVALAPFAADLPMRTAGLRRVWAARARLACAQGDPAAALAIVDRLLASAINLTGEHDIPLLALLRGESLTALGRHDEAATALHAALDGATARGLRPLGWRSHIALSHLYKASARPAEAGRQVHRARTVALDLAGTLPPDLRSAFLARVDTAPTGRSRAPQHPGSVLTAREQEVAILVARGLANRAIADTLVVGERTVETHVGNILGKLGFHSRTELAVWAIESGLVRVAE